MPISGVLLKCGEEAIESVRQAIDTHPRVEIRYGTGTMLAVVTDTVTLACDRALVNWLASLPGVISAFITYSNIEDLVESAPVAGGDQ